MRPLPPSADRRIVMSSSGYIRMNSERSNRDRDEPPLSLDTSMPNFLHAARIRSLTSDRVTPFIGYWPAFFSWLMYDQAARACSSVSTGYLPFLGSAYVTSPYGFFASARCVSV